MTEKWFTPRRFLLVLGVLVFVSFPGVLIGTQTFVFRDFGLFSYPVAFFQRQCFWHGKLPLWDPLSLCGLPFLAQWNTLALYPPSLFYLLFPLPWALPVFCLLHLTWGGLGMYLLAEDCTQNRIAAALAGVVFAFNGLAQNFLMWPSHIATFSWAPWVWWLTPLAWRTGGKNMVWAIAAAALQMLAGAPETIFATWIILLVLAGGEWLQQKRSRKLLLARLGGMAAVVALLCAAQLLPFLELLIHSQRGTGYGSKGWSVAPWGWANFLVPLFRTKSTPQGVYFQIGQGWTSSFYAGIGTVWLGLVAVYRVRSWRVRVFAVLLAVCLLLALGDSGGLYPVLRSWVPLLGFMRFPVKFIIPVLALAPLLAAFGLAAIIGQEDSASTKNRLAPSNGKRSAQGACRAKAPTLVSWGTAVALLALVGWIMLRDAGPSDATWRTTFQNGLARAGFLVLLPALISGISRTGGRTRFLLGCLSLLVFWLDLRTHMPPQNPTVSPEIYKPGWAASYLKWNPPPRLGESRALLGPEGTAELQFRALPKLDQTYLGHRLGLLADCNLLDGIPQVHGFFSLAPGPIDNLTTALNAQPDADFSPLLDFMGVCQISSSEKVLEWVARTNAMPLVTAGQRAVFADDSAMRAAFTNPAVNFRRMAFLPSEAEASITATPQPQARVEALNWANDHVSFKTDAPGPSLVVIAQTYYPVWKAYVDDKPVRLWRANYAFQALQVPRGRHSVRLVYEDRMLHLGLVFSGLGLLILIALGLTSHLPLRLHKPAVV